MHPGSIHTDTAAARVFRVLQSAEGRWLSGLELSQLAYTTCVSTRISEINAQLPDGQRVEYERRGRNGHFYRLVVRGQMELAV